MSIVIVVCWHESREKLKEVGKPSLTTFVKKSDSQSSNYAGFNPILQKFYERICEIIVSKTVCGIFLFFYQSSFINDFMEKNNF